MSFCLCYVFTQNVGKEMTFLFLGCVYLLDGCQEFHVKLFYCQMSA